MIKFRIFIVFILSISVYVDCSINNVIGYGTLVNSFGIGSMLMIILDDINDYYKNKIKLFEGK